jgi:hypothetical protein
MPRLQAPRQISGERLRIELRRLQVLELMRNLNRFFKCRQCKVKCRVAMAAVMERHA